MLLSKSTRKRVSAWMVGVLLLVQWLVAAHACMPAHASGAAQAAQHEPKVAVHCHGGDLADTVGAPSHEPGLCQAHCVADGQAPSSTAPADLPVHALGWCLVAAAPALVADAGAVALTTPVRAGAPPGWPPLYLLHRVLRN